METSNLPQPDCLYEIKHRKSKSSFVKVPDIAYCSCLFPQLEPIEKRLCQFCAVILCVKCMKSLSFNDFNSHSTIMCESCLNDIYSSPEIAPFQTQLSELKREIESLSQNHILIESQRAEALETLRKHNLILSKLESDWGLQEKSISSDQNQILNIIHNLELDLNNLIQAKSHINSTIMLTHQHILQMENEISDIEGQISRDKERILQIEHLIKDQHQEALKITEKTLFLQEKQTIEEEILKQDESTLSEKLAKVRKQCENAKKTNKFLSKRLQEHVEQEDVPKVSFEIRGENYKKLIEQWAAQEILIKQLQGQVGKHSMSAQRCKCMIF